MIKKVLLLALEFCVCAALSFLFFSRIPVKVEIGEEDPVPAVKEEVVEAPETPVVEEEVVVDNRPTVMYVSRPKYDEKTQRYHFTVEASSNAVQYCLTDEKENHLNFDRSDGEFSVPARSDGKYRVYVTDIHGNKSDTFPVEGCTIQLKKVTEEELENLLMAKNINNAKNELKGRMAGKVHYDYVGIDPNEEPDTPESYSDIITRLTTKTWTSVQVQKITYNQEGKVVNVKIAVTPNY